MFDTLSEGPPWDASARWWGCASQHHQAPGELSTPELWALPRLGRQVCSATPRSWVSVCLLREVASPVLRCEMISDSAGTSLTDKW